MRDGIVFMGFDERETQWMQETMEEERLWQGTPASVQQDLEYLRGSAPGLVDVINLIDKLGAVPDRRRLIDVGSGSGWGSRLFAEAGYDPWMVDFEPNSLWLGGLTRTRRWARASGSSPTRRSCRSPTGRSTSRS